MTQAQLLIFGLGIGGTFRQQSGIARGVWE